MHIVHQIKLLFEIWYNKLQLKYHLWHNLNSSFNFIYELLFAFFLNFLNDYFLTFNSF